MIGPLRIFLKTPLLAGFFILAIALTVHRQTQGKSVTSHLLPPLEIRHFHFGYKYPMADGYWLRTIQAMDQCREETSHLPLCQSKGWLFAVFDLITDLSPDFYIPAAIGPIVLDVFLDDFSGAAQLANKSVQNFPNDWNVLYRASYVALFSEKNDSKAADLLIRAAKAGAPQWIYSLAARLYSRNGKVDLAKALYENLKQSGTEQRILDNVLHRIKTLGK